MIQFSWCMCKTPHAVKVEFMNQSAVFVAPSYQSMSCQRRKIIIGRIGGWLTIEALKLQCDLSPVGVATTWLPW